MTGPRGALPTIGIGSLDAEIEARFEALAAALEAIGWQIGFAVQPDNRLEIFGPNGRLWLEGTIRLKEAPADG
jgi:hypothetical protein